MLCLDKGKSDAHGCFQNLGESYSYLKKACVQVFDVADIKLDDPDNKTQAVYGICRKISNRLRCLLLIYLKIQF